MSYTSKIYPTKNFVAVAERKSSTTTSSGIIIESGGGDTKLGVIVAVGPDATTCNVGDTVLPKWSEGLKLTIDGKSCVLLKDIDIAAVIV